MSEATDRKRHAMLWAGAVPGAVLFYFFSVPWVDNYVGRYGGSNVVLEWYEAPYYFMIEHTPGLGEPMQSYYLWCMEKVGP